MSAVLEEPDEVLADILSLCSKVRHNFETMDRVYMSDLVELRDKINDVRRHVANGGGYASLPRLVRASQE